MNWLLMLLLVGSVQNVFADSFYFNVNQSSVVNSGEEFYVSILRSPQGKSSQEVKLRLDVLFSSANGSARKDDFSKINQSQTVTFEQFAPSKRVYIGKAKYDLNLGPNNKTFVVRISSLDSCPACFETRNKTFQMLENHVIVSCFANHTFEEGTDSHARILVQRQVGRSLQPLSTQIWCYTADGTADGDRDYSAVMKSITFSPESTQQFIDVGIKNDKTFEDPENFTVTCFNDKDFDRVTSTCNEEKIIILDDDSELFFCDDMKLNMTENIGNYTFDVCRDGNINAKHSFDVCFSGDRSSSPSFIRRCTANLTFSVNEARMTVVQPIIDDKVVEKNSKMIITLERSDLNIRGSKEALVTLIDDDINFEFPPSTTLVLKEESNSEIKVQIIKSGVEKAATASVELDFVTASPSDCVGPLSKNISFAANETNKSVTICTVVNDSLVEPKELFYIRLKGLNGAFAIPGSDQIKVEIQSPGANVTCLPTSTKVKENGPRVAITINRAGDVSNENDQIWCNATNGTAHYPSDYAIRSEQIKFNKNFHKSTLNIPIIKDIFAESNETFKVTCDTTDPSLHLFPSCKDIEFTIINDDVYVSFCPGLATNVKEGDGPYNVHICRDGDIPESFIVRLCWKSDVNTLPGAVDYPSVQAGCENITFTAGVGRKSHLINIADDKWGEKEYKSFQVQLSTTGSQVNINGSSSYLVFVLDDDNSFCMTTPALKFSEENRGYVNVTVTRSGAITTTSASVSLKSIQGSAVQGQDYNYQNTVLDFAKNETEKTISMEIIDDKVVEEDEEFSLLLEGEGGSTIIPECKNKTTVTIVSNDVSISCTSSSYNVHEDSSPVTIMLTRTGALQYSHTLRIQTVNGTGKANEDFVPFDTNFTYYPNQTSLTYRVMFIKDVILEPDKSFHIEVTSTDKRVNIDCPRINFNILNDDTLLHCMSTNVSITDEMKLANFTVKREGNLQKRATIWYTTVDGTAHDKDDYQPVNKKNVTFEPGQESITESVDIVVDNFYEGTEYFTVKVGSDDPNIIVPKNCTRIHIMDKKRNDNDQRGRISQKQAQEIINKKESIMTLLIVGIVLVGIVMIAILMICVCVAR